MGRRVFAAIFDLVAYWGLWWAAFLAVAESGPALQVTGGQQLRLSLGDTSYHLDGAQANAFWAISLAVAFAWFGLLPGITGWTPGKLLFGMRVRRPDGSRAGIWRNLARAALWVVDGFPYFLPGLVGFVLVLANDGRRVADLVAGTIVVRKG